MISYWFGDVDGEHCMPAPREKEALLKRISSIRTNLREYTPADWQLASKAGFVRDRMEYLKWLHLLCMEVTEVRVRQSLERDDGELIRLVGLLDALAFSINHIREQLSRLQEIDSPLRRGPHTVAKRPKEFRDGEGAHVSLAPIAEELIRMERVRASLTQQIAQRADRVAPNCSALLGGTVAARLIARAGGLEKLACMPSSSIQILGAEKALFAHLRGGEPPPKHGVIFQHGRVHAAPRTCRGRVARVIASRTAISARLDLYRGVLDREFIEETERRVARAMKRA
ncbi:MAG: RNA-processing protein [Methanomicrobiales archaeon]|nr:RNA-processing protein [Methanomicrobiales archaeon]